MRTIILFDSFWGRDILCHTLLSEVQNPLIITHSNTCSPDLSLCIRAKDSNPRKYPNAHSFECCIPCLQVRSGDLIAR